MKILHAMMNALKTCVSGPLTRAFPTPMWGAFPAVLLFEGLLFGVIFFVTDGHFHFATDDAYIHLTQAENLLKGHIGVMESETAWGCSSILFPLLLAPFEAVSLGAFGVAFWNVVGVLWLAAVALLFLGRGGLAETLKGRMVATGVVLVGLIPVYALSWMGMEHTLHVASVVAVVYGLWRWKAEGEIPRWFTLAVVGTVLIRYESLALVLAVLFLLARARMWRTFVLQAGLLLLTVGGFSVFLVSLGQPWLPTSVLIKSHVLVQADVGGMLDRFFMVLSRTLLNSREALIVMILGLALLGAAFFPPERHKKTAWAVSGAVAFAVLAHLLLGRFGWAMRYELYLVFSALLVLGALFMPHLRDMAARGPVRLAVLGVLTVLLVGYPYLRMVTQVPRMASQTWRQSCLIGRYVRDYYQKPTAVTDIGCAAYHNDVPVLDLWGIGMDRLRRRRAAYDGNDWFRDLTAEKNIGLAVVAANWFNPGELPEDWYNFASITLSEPPIFVPAQRLIFLAATPRDALQAARRLRTLVREDFPPEVRVVFNSKLLNRLHRM